MTYPLEASKLTKTPPKSCGKLSVQSVSACSICAGADTDARLSCDFRGRAEAFLSCTTEAARRTLSRINMRLNSRGCSYRYQKLWGGVTPKNITGCNL